MRAPPTPIGRAPASAPGGHSLGVTVGARGQAGKQEPGDHIPPIVPRCPQSRGRGPDNGVTDNRDQQMVPHPLPHQLALLSLPGLSGRSERGPGPSWLQTPAAHLPTLGFWKEA